MRELKQLIAGLIKKKRPFEEVSTGLDQFLARNPDDRQQSATELAANVQIWLDAVADSKLRRARAAEKVAEARTKLAVYRDLQSQVGGAANAVCKNGSSLLAIGITQVNGSFQRGSVVSLHDPSGQEIARGLCNYPSSEVERILGQPSEKISEILGHRPYENVVHRNNMVLTGSVDS